MRLEMSSPGMKELAMKMEGANRVVPPEMDRALRSIGKELVKAMKSEAPKKTGELRKSHQAKIYKMNRHQSRLTITSADHGVFVREGTRPHIIRPRNAKVLSFYWDAVGSQVFFAFVRHPGTKPNKYHNRAWRRVQPQARRIISEMQKRINERVTVKRVS